jgi:hypothetical protein
VRIISHCGERNQENVRHIHVAAEHNREDVTSHAFVFRT